MQNLVEVAMDKEIRDNPQKIAEMIMELAEDIESCQHDLSEIKDRRFFKRMITNNTKDLADAMIKQNDTISLFLNIVQSLIMFNMNNTVILAEIQRELTLHERGRGEFQNKYIAMAQEYITESYNAAMALKGQLDSQSEAIRNIEEQLKKIDSKKNSATMNTIYKSNSILDSKSTGWKLRKSWWLLFGLSFGVLNWIIFLFIGFKVKHKRWFVYGGLYSIPFFIYMIWPESEVTISILLISGFAALIHAFSIRNEYLMRCILLESIEPKELHELEQRLYKEYGLVDNAASTKEVKVEVQNQSELNSEVKVEPM